MSSNKFLFFLMQTECISLNCIKFSFPKGLSSFFYGCHLFSLFIYVELQSNIFCRHYLIRQSKEESNPTQRNEPLLQNIFFSCMFNNIWGKYHVGEYLFLLCKHKELYTIKIKILIYNSWGMQKERYFLANFITS